MRRVLILGCPGAGKSTTGRRLAEITGLPLIYLDRHYWQPGWVRPPPELWRAKLRELVDQPRWIIDGNYGGTLDLRLRAADTLIHLDFSTLLCGWRVARRTMTGLGRSRPEELVEGCPERIDWSFFRFVLRYRSSHRARDMAKMAAFEGNLHRFTSPRSLDAFLATLATEVSFRAPR